jgi:hypothetical protein
VTEAAVSVTAVMSELQGRVRERLRTELLRNGGSPAFEDPRLFAEVLGDPETWRLETAIRYQSHRTPGAASLLIFLKRRVLMPVLRWLFEYSRDNFERQRRVNRVLFACVQELALETARLRQELDRRARPSTSSGRPEPVEGR